MYIWNMTPGLLIIALSVCKHWDTGNYINCNSLPKQGGFTCPQNRHKAAKYLSIPTQLHNLSPTSAYQSKLQTHTTMVIWMRLLHTQPSTPSLHPTPSSQLPYTLYSLSRVLHSHGAITMNLRQTWLNCPESTYTIAKSSTVKSSCAKCMQRKLHKDTIYTVYYPSISYPWD